ncbi:FMRFamide receptor [Biomphalaria glabrata]|nr:FMRFamide receptor-like [Biomphalaria glabrata]
MPQCGWSENVTETVVESFVAPDLTISVEEKLLLAPLHFIASVSGVCTNAINLLILTSLGIRSSVSVATVALSISDLCTSATEMLIVVSYIISYTCQSCPVDFRSISFIPLGWIRYPGFFISSWITTFISIERCCSVVLPFKVKQIFSTKLTSIIIILTSCLFMGIVYQIFASITVLYESVSCKYFDQSDLNYMVLTFTYKNDSSETEWSIDITCAMFLSLLSQAILIFCTVWMTFTLRSSSKVRRLERKDHTNVAGTQRKGWLKGSALSEKERRLIKVTLCLALIITGCNVPRYMTLTLFYTVFITDMAAWASTSLILWGMGDCLISLSYSSNFCVYFLLNRKFKQRFSDLFLNSKLKKK